MISFSNINKQYGKQLLFVDASFQLNPGEKVGLIGPNEAGKTTLFRMVVGEETPDEVREMPRLYDFCMATIETSA
jgi:ATPase subunit of ABC transporter with duplicated ATPase domains